MNKEDTLKLGTWEFHVLDKKDMLLYSMYIKSTKCPTNLWSSNFAYMWAVSRSKRRTLLWRVIDGLLVTFAKSYKNTLYIYCLPFGNAQPDKLLNVTLFAMNYCLAYNGQDKKRTVIRMINEAQLGYLKKARNFSKYFTLTEWVGIERHFDIEAVSALKGKQFENIRNRLNKFRRENPDAKIEPYSEKDFDALMALSEHWKKTSGQKYGVLLDGVYYRELVKHGRELDQKTIVIKKEEKIIGMISGGLLPDGQAWGSVMKFEDKIPGLSETLLVEYTRFINKLSPKSRYLNTGSDLGPGGLRTYKLKFNPGLNFKRYQIYLR